MVEGWFKDNYFIIFDEDENLKAIEEYNLSQYLPGYYLVGIIGWDDFIVGSESQLYRVPTVPLGKSYLEEISPEDMPLELDGDSEACGKIKWYVTPLVVGGSSSEEENISWVSHKEHRQLVRFWNEKLSEK